jgi:uncharacterized protein involved in exopolysaccharide biosynthesis
MTSAGRDSTLADYVHVIRRAKWTMLLVGLICAAIAVFVSVLQTPNYQAQASESVRDPSQDLSLTGTSYSVPRRRCSWPRRTRPSSRGFP